MIHLLFALAGEQPYREGHTDAALIAPLFGLRGVQLLNQPLGGLELLHSMLQQTQPEMPLHQPPQGSTAQDSRAQGLSCKWSLKLVAHLKVE